MIRLVKHILEHAHIRDDFECSTCGFEYRYDEDDFPAEQWIRAIHRAPNNEELQLCDKCVPNMD